MNSEEKVSVLNRAELRMHLIMCKHCSGYAKQLNLMKVGFKNLFSQLTKIEPGKVEQIEDQVIEKIKKTSSGE